MIEWLAAINLWDAAIWVGGAVSFVVGVRVFVRRAWPWLRSFAQAILSTAQLIDSVKGLPAFIERTDARISEIHHEVHFNNGSSVKDSAIRTERAVGELTETAGRLEVGVAGLYRRVDELAAVDDRLWATVDPEDEEDNG